tara:strand:+ start:794 stop:1603 length:810 start_codon:yes stop_codon:yes gene_type:complete
MTDTAVFEKLLRSDDKHVETLIERLYTQVLRPDHSAIDVGAHTGRHTIPLSKLLPNGRVIAIEALAEYASRLADRIEKQAIENVTIISAATQDDSSLKELSFEFIPDRPGRSSIKSATKDSPINGKVMNFAVERRAVPASTIDIILLEQNIAPDEVGFIKLDIEGGEFFALKGAIGCLRSGRPIAAMESAIRAADTYGYTNAAMFEFFASIDYVLLDIVGNAIDEISMRRFNEIVCCPREICAPIQNLLRREAEELLLTVDAASGAAAR